MPDQQQSFSFREQAIENLRSDIKQLEAEIKALEAHLKTKKSELKLSQKSLAGLTGEKPSRAAKQPKKKAA